jgi:hypothetical protein
LRASSPPVRLSRGITAPRASIPRLPGQPEKAGLASVGLSCANALPVSLTILAQCTHHGQKARLVPRRSSLVGGVTTPRPFADPSANYPASSLVMIARGVTTPLQFGPKGQTCLSSSLGPAP